MASLILKVPARRVPLLVSAQRVWTPTPWTPPMPWTQQPVRPCPCQCFSRGSIRAVSTTPQGPAATETDEQLVGTPVKRRRRRGSKPPEEPRMPPVVPSGLPGDMLSVQVPASKRGRRAGSKKKKPAPKPEEPAIDTSPYLQLVAQRRSRPVSKKKKSSHPLYIGDLLLPQLRELAALCGRSVTPAKAIISKDLEENIINAPFEMQKRRVLSIDMGVRNLAYCLLEFDPSTNGPAELVAWERLSLIDDKEYSEADPSERQVMFSPPRMAEKAVQLVIDKLLPLSPTHILIERQRSRSAGGMGVLEWTIRVNALEAMLHGILSYHQVLTAAKSKGDVATVEAVSPRRVAVFLMNGGIGDGTGRGKVPDTILKTKSRRDTTSSKEKGIKETKENIVAKVLHTAMEHKRLAGSELEAGGLPADLDQDALLDYGNSVRAMVRAYIVRWRKKQRRTKSGEDFTIEVGAEAETKTAEAAAAEAGSVMDAMNAAPVLAGEKPQVAKIDDLADCVVQGLVWIEWERNKMFLLQNGVKPTLEQKPLLNNNTSNGIDAVREYDQ